MAKNKDRVEIPAEMSTREFHIVLKKLGFEVGTDGTQALFNGRRFSISTRRDKKVPGKYVRNLHRTALAACAPNG